MNWDAIGAIGEVVGAVAVVATLIYFSMQIRSLSADSYANSINQVVRATSYGRDGEIQIGNIVRVLRNYPCFVPLFESADFRSDVGVVGQELLKCVDTFRTS